MHSICLCLLTVLSAFLVWKRRIQYSLTARLDLDTGLPAIPGSISRDHKADATTSATVTD